MCDRRIRITIVLCSLIVVVLAWVNAWGLGWFESTRYQAAWTLTVCIVSAVAGYLVISKYLILAEDRDDREK